MLNAFAVLSSQLKAAKKITSEITKIRILKQGKGMGDKTIEVNI